MDDEFGEAGLADTAFAREKDRRRNASLSVIEGACEPGYFVVTSDQGKGAERGRLVFGHVMIMSETNPSNAPVRIKPARGDWAQM